MGEYVIDRRDLAPIVHGATNVRWWLFLMLGIASVVIGLALLLDLAAAVTTLALLVALGFFASGLGELFGAGRYRTAWSVVSGFIMVAAGVIAVVWPDVTLWALAVITGIGLLVTGGLRLGAALADRPDGWGWLGLSGAFSLGVGVMALIWPGATILVLALLFGIRLVLFGAAEIAFALALRDVTR